MEPDSTVPNTGFFFEGTAEDYYGISEVEVSLFNWGRLTVFGELASYDPLTHKWSYFVGQDRITAGQKATLYVRAKDIHGIKSAWKSVTVTVQWTGGCYGF